MTTNMSFINLILNASIIVQFVMLLLLIASIGSWNIIFTKQKLIKKIKTTSDSFETNFWAGGDLNALYQNSNKNEHGDIGMPSIFRV
jgi:biopolymer transport protein TolQ